MSANTPRILGRDDEFAYQESYGPEEIIADAHRWSRPFSHNELTIEGERFTPTDALLQYRESVAGSWHAGQTARYDGMHARLKLHRNHDIERGSPEYSRAQKAMLTLLSHERVIGSDMSPVGHGAVLTGLSNEMREFFVPHTDDPTILIAGRHVFPNHDTGENTFPGLLERTKVVGDIESGKKTLAQKELETEVARLVLSDEGPLEDIYPPEVNDLMLRMMSHDTDSFSQAELESYLFYETVHSINFMRNAIGLARSAANTNASYDYSPETMPTRPRWARTSMARLAVQIRNKQLIKLPELFKQFDEPILRDRVELEIDDLEQEISAIPSRHFDDELRIDEASPFFGLPDISVKQQQRAHYYTRSLRVPRVPLKLL